MCLAALRLADGGPHRVALVANRDEFHARPTAPLGWWTDRPVLGGRDLEAGGTWFALDRAGRFGLLTNLRGYPIPAHAPSRGELIPAFLAADRSAADFLERLEGRAHRYAGYNLLLGDASGVWLHANDGATPIRRLEAGYHGLANGPYGSAWAKVTVAVAAFEALFETGTPRERWQEALRDPTPLADDRLPDTGLGAAIERPLSAAFIVQPHYGTRSTTTCVLGAPGTAWVQETRYDPTGTPCGESTETLP
jgi:uncharacterized protein with NRDE domain